MNNGPFNNDDPTTVIFPKPNHPNVNSKKNESDKNEAILPTALIGESALAQVSPTLLSIATDIFSIATVLGNTPTYQHIGTLKKQLLATVIAFEEQAKKFGLSQITEGSFGLCVFLDEMIQKTPWGFHSDWARENLVIQCHGHGLGGEKFFTNLEGFIKKPIENKQVLELYYAILSLGFTGKFAEKPNELEKKRTELHGSLQQFNGEFTWDLSAQWQGRHSNQATKITEVIPVWVTATLSAAVLLLVYLVFTFFINQVSDTTNKTLIQLSKEPMQFAQSQSLPLLPVKPEPQPNHRTCEQRIRDVLQNVQTNSHVEVEDGCVIHIRNLFDSASDQVKPEFKPLIQKMAKELKQGTDSILVVGHTDDKPIISLRFPSNWHLSSARAKHVLSLLKASAQLQGHAEGRGDAEPLLPNDTPENRATNRRVDIFIK